ncbi:hypothetical protein COCOBI_11-2780 [Coccomyxa sp. Obi]|nr:hypothetical protein COCOBI_11-2780 [Coccomyxa sp. Obi]
MMPNNWALGPGSACKALHNLKLKRLQLSLLEDNMPGRDYMERQHRIYLGLKWVTKQLRHLKTLDLNVTSRVGGRGANDTNNDNMESIVRALRRGDGPNLLQAFRVSCGNTTRSYCIEELLTWLLARMDKLEYLDVNYRFRVFPGALPALANIKRLRLVTQLSLKAPLLAPELRLLPKLEELSIYDDYNMSCDYHVDDASFTARNYKEEFDLRQLSALVRIGFDQMVTERVRLPPGCLARVRTPTMDLDRPVCMEKLTEDLADAWTDHTQQLHHFVQTNMAPGGFDLRVLQQFSSIRCLELDGNDVLSDRPSSWPKLDQCSVDLAQFNLSYLESIRLLLSRKRPVTVIIVLPRKIPLKCLEVVTNRVMLSIEDPDALGNTLDRVAIVGKDLQSNINLQRLWECLKGRGYSCAIAEFQGRQTQSQMAIGHTHSVSAATPWGL